MLLTILVLSILNGCDEPADYVCRAKVLESNTIVILKVTANQRNLLNQYDTVWVNMITHKIDDTCNTAMKCVILPINN